MAIFYTTENNGVDALPVIKPSAQAYNGTVKVFQATINLATVNAGSAVTTSDQIVLADVPAGYKFLFGVLTISATLGTSVIAIGTNQTHASNGQYRAAGTFTTTDTPTLFGVTATGVAAAATTATTRIWLTVATANLPTSGTVSVELFYAYDN